MYVYRLRLASFTMRLILYKNKYTSRSYIYFECKSKPSLNVKINLNLHCGYSLVGSFYKLAQRGKMKTFISVW